MKTVFAIRPAFFLLVFKKFLRLLLNEFLQSEKMQKSRPVQNVTSIIAVANG